MLPLIQTGGGSGGGGGVNIGSSQGMGYFWGVAANNDSGTGGTATIISPTGANQVLVFQFVLPYAVTVTRVVFAKGGTVVAGSHANFGLYDTSKNLVLDSGQFDTSAGGAAVQTNTVSKVVPAGVYWFAQAATDATVTGGINITYGTGTNATVRNTNSPANNGRQGTAANTLSGGALPATLGNISSATNRVPVGILFEP